MLSSTVPLLTGLLANVVLAQQFVGTSVNNSLPSVVGAELTYWNILDANNRNATLINYSSLGSNGQRLAPSNIQRALVFVHGNNRDPFNYMSYMLSAFSQIQGHPEITHDNVQMVAPYFPNGDDKNYGYPWNASAPAGGYGSTSPCLVWSGAGWMNGSNTQYPRGKNVPSYAVLDQILQYYDNKTLFPNLQQIVLGGHSAGAQTVQRYIAVNNKLNLKTPVSYWIGNPDSYLWFTADRPLDTSNCPTYDWWRAGLSQYTNTYGASLVASGREAVYDNYNSHTIHYARGTDDVGDDSSTCGAFTQGANRNERFANFIEAFPPVACSSGGACNTVDYVPIGHDAGGMMSSLAGQSRLFLDNFNGTGNQAYDFGCPRFYTGDNPFPDPSCNAMATPEDQGTYAGGFQYSGCYSDTEYPSNTLPYTAYQGWSNATIDTCTSACSAQGYALAGAEAGNACYCGNTMFWQTYGPLTEASCSVNCTGDDTQICGDQQRLSIFSLNGATPAKNPQPSSPATVGSFSYEGCYQEPPAGRALTGPSNFQNSMTVEMCVNFCNNQGYSIAGLEYYTQCFCGHELALGANQTYNGLCNFPCGGNQSEFCGGSGTLNVYAVNSTFGQPWTGPTSTPTTSAIATTPTATTPTTTSATVATTYPAATGALSCPGSNQQTFTTNGETFVVECFADRAGGDIGGAVPFDTALEGCIQSCATTPGCLDVSWVPGSSAGTAYPCYMKTQVNPATSNTGIWGARYLGSSNSTFVYSTSSSVASSTTATTPSSSSSVASSTTTTSSSSSSASTTSSLTTSSTGATTSSASTPASTSTSTSSTTSSPSSTPTSLQCPTANATTFTAGKDTFEIECGNDRQGASVGLQYVDSLNDCINWCANTTSCVDVSWLPGPNAPCYLKSSIGASQLNVNVWGARLIAVNGLPLPTSTTSTSALQSPTSSATSVQATRTSSSSSKPSKPGKQSSTSSSSSSSSSSAAISPTSSSSGKAPKPGKNTSSALISSSSAMSTSKSSTTSAAPAKVTSSSSTSTLASTSSSAKGGKGGKGGKSTSSPSTSTSSTSTKTTSSSLASSTTSSGKPGKPGKTSSAVVTTTKSSTISTSSTTSSKPGKGGKASSTSTLLKSTSSSTSAKSTSSSTSVKKGGKNVKTKTTSSTSSTSTPTTKSRRHPRRGN